MLRKFFHNSKVSTKLFALVVVMIVLMLALSAIAFRGLRGQKSAMQDLFENRFQAYQESSKIADTVLSANAHIYKVVNMINLEKQESEVDEEIQHFMEMLEKAQSLIILQGQLDKEALAASSKDEKQLTEALNAIKPSVDHIAQTLKAGESKGEDGMSLAEQEKLLCRDIYLAVSKYRLAIEAVMPTVKIMKLVGAEMAAGMMAGTETDFKALLDGLGTLNAFEKAHAEASYVSSQDFYHRTLSLFASTTGVAVILSVLLAVLIVRGITGPLRKAVTMIQEMEKGHLDTRLRFQGQDEISQMGRAMDDFADNLQQEVVAALVRLSQGDLSFEAKPRDEQDVVRGALRALGDDLNGLIARIYVAGQQIAAGSSQVADSSQTLSQGATEQASSLEEITSSMTEMGSQTRLNAENATQANGLAKNAREMAAGGNSQMQSMVQAMEEINEAGENISKIIKVIDEIAFQTNLLALNAAVEAARAGQHGKGFAVVAEEVRNLAARSAKAARETAELIEGSVRKTEKGAEIAGKTAGALKEIVGSIAKVSDLVEEIAAASNEQAQGIAQVSQGLMQIDQVTQQNTASAEQSAAAAAELSGQAIDLQKVLSRFTLKEAQSEEGPSIRQLPAY